eukprot:TRINITY_DN442_c0_g1_i4.p1 TRINITY_DN442_c0_g1~~TRINITY_DN442_c0_g1_i4.p1  ORF type:complete len:2805 (+),score=739.29 TRINITY_DN442_c0_g1_i4:119-8533(+)
MLRRIVILLLVLAAAAERAANQTEESLWVMPSAGEVFLGAAAFGVCGGITMYTPLGVPVVTWMAEHGMLGLVWEPATTFVAAHTTQAALTLGTSIASTTVIATRVLSSFFTPTPSPPTHEKPTNTRTQPKKQSPPPSSSVPIPKKQQPTVTPKPVTSEPEKVKQPPAVQKDQKKEQLIKRISSEVEAIRESINFPAVTYEQPKPVVVEVPVEEPTPVEPVKAPTVNKPKKQPFQHDDWTQTILMGASFIVVLIWTIGILTKKTKTPVLRPASTPVHSPRVVKAEQETTPGTVYVDDIMKVCKTLGVPSHPWGTPSPTHEKPLKNLSPFPSNDLLATPQDSRVSEIDSKLSELITLFKREQDTDMITKLENKISDTEGKVNRVLDLISAKSKERSSAADTVKKLESKMEQLLSATPTPTAVPEEFGEQFKQLTESLLSRLSETDELLKQNAVATNTRFDSVLSKISETDARLNQQQEVATTNNNSIQQLLERTATETDAKFESVLSKISENDSKQNQEDVSNVQHLLERTATATDTMFNAVLSKISETDTKLNQQQELVTTNNNSIQQLLVQTAESETKLDSVLSKISENDTNRSQEDISNIQHLLERTATATDTMFNAVLSKISETDTKLNQQQELVTTSNNSIQQLLEQTAAETAAKFDSVFSKISENDTNRSQKDITSIQQLLEKTANATDTKFNSVLSKLSETDNVMKQHQGITDTKFNSVLSQISETKQHDIPNGTDDHIKQLVEKAAATDVKFDVVMSKVQQQEGALQQLLQHASTTEQVALTVQQHQQQGFTQLLDQTGRAHTSIQGGLQELVSLGRQQQPSSEHGDMLKSLMQTTTENNNQLTQQVQINRSLTEKVLSDITNTIGQSLRTKDTQPEGNSDQNLTSEMIDQRLSSLRTDVIGQLEQISLRLEDCVSKENVEQMNEQQAAVTTQHQVEQQKTLSEIHNTCTQATSLMELSASSTSSLSSVVGEILSLLQKREQHPVTESQPVQNQIPSSNSVEEEHQVAKVLAKVESLFSNLQQVSEQKSAAEGVASTQISDVITAFKKEVLSKVEDISLKLQSNEQNAEASNSTASAQQISELIASSNVELLSNVQALLMSLHQSNEQRAAATSTASAQQMSELIGASNAELLSKVEGLFVKLQSSEQEDSSTNTQQIADLITASNTEVLSKVEDLLLKLESSKQTATDSTQQISELITASNTEVLSKIEGLLQKVHQEIATSSDGTASTQQISELITASNTELQSKVANIVSKSQEGSTSELLTKFDSLVSKADHLQLTEVINKKNDNVVSFLEQQMSGLITTCSNSTTDQLKQLTQLLEQQHNDGKQTWCETIGILTKLAESNPTAGIVEIQGILTEMKQGTAAAEISEMGETLRRFITNKHQELEQTIQSHEHEKLSAISGALKAIHSARDMLISEEIPNNTETNNLSVILKTELDNINNGLLDIKTVQVRDREHAADQMKEMKEQLVSNTALDGIDAKLSDIDELLYSLQTDRELKQQESERLVEAIIGIRDLLVSKDDDPTSTEIVKMIAELKSSISNSSTNQMKEVISKSHDELMVMIQSLLVDEFGPKLASLEGAQRTSSELDASNIENISSLLTSLIVSGEEASHATAQAHTELRKDMKTWQEETSHATTQSHNELKEGIKALQGETSRVPAQSHSELKEDMKALQEASQTAAQSHNELKEGIKALQEETSRLSAQSYSELKEGIKALQEETSRLSAQSYSELKEGIKALQEETSRLSAQSHSELKEGMQALQEEASQTAAQSHNELKEGMKALQEEVEKCDTGRVLVKIKDLASLLNVVHLGLKDETKQSVIQTKLDNLLEDKLQTLSETTKSSLHKISVEMESRLTDIGEVISKSSGDQEWNLTEISDKLQLVQTHLFGLNPDEDSTSIAAKLDSFVSSFSQSGQDGQGVNPPTEFNSMLQASQAAIITEVTSKVQQLLSKQSEQAPSTVSSKIEELENKITTLKGEQTDTKLTSKLEEITKLLTDAASADVASKIEQLGSQMKSLSDSEMNSKLEDVASKVEELVGQVKSLNGDKTDSETTSKLDEITKALTNLSNTDVTSKIEELASQVKSLGEEKTDSEMNSKLEDITSKIEELMGQMKSLSGDKTDGETTSKLEEITKLLTDAASADVASKIKELGSQMKSLGEGKTDTEMNSKFEDVTSKIEGLKAEVQSLNGKNETIANHLRESSTPEQLTQLIKKVDVVSQLIGTLLKSDKSTDPQTSEKLQEVTQLVESLKSSVDTELPTRLQKISVDLTDSLLNSLKALLCEDVAIPTKLNDIKELFSNHQIASEVATKVSSTIHDQDATIPQKLEEIKKLISTEGGKDTSHEMVELKNKESDKIIEALSSMKESLISKQQEIVELVSNGEDSDLTALSGKQQEMLATIESLEQLVSSNQTEMETFIKKTIEKNSIAKREGLQAALRNFDIPYKARKETNLRESFGDAVTSDGESVCTPIPGTISPKETSLESDFLDRLGRRIDGTMRCTIQLVERQRLIGKHVLYNQKMLLFRYYWKLIEFYRVRFSIKNEMRIEEEKMKFADLCDTRRLVAKHWCRWRTELSLARKEQAGLLTEPRSVDERERLKSLSPLKLFSLQSPNTNDDDYRPVPIFDSPMHEDVPRKQKSKPSKRPPPKFTTRRGREPETPTQKIPAEESYVQKIFKLIDSNNDGLIDATDFRRALNQHREVKKLFQIPEATGGPNCHLCARVWQILATDGVSKLGTVTWDAFANYFDFLSSPSCTSKTFDGRKRHGRNSSAVRKSSPPPHLTSRTRSNSYSSPSCKTLEFS